MAEITRYDPFQDLEELFEGWPRGFFFRPVRFEGEARGALTIKMDVSENDKAYTVRAEIPGVKKEDINVSVDGNQVSISAEVKKEKQEKQGEKVLRSERYYGKVYRSFTLGQEVDQAAASAKYGDGVLELTLPKKAGTQAKQLSIS